MIASELLKSCEVPFSGDLDFPLHNVQLDSRLVQPNDMFMAVKGANVKGSEYIQSAIEKGAVLVLSDTPFKADKTPIIFVPKLKSKISHITNIFLGDPLSKVKCIGVTGTNGKSTVTKLLGSIFKADGKKVISIGTINNEIGDEIFAADLTTPNPVDLITWIHKGVQKECEVAVMEVSSHALAQDRVEAIPFQAAIFTNLTQDHLDYHKTFENYFEAKKKLFTQCLAKDGVAVINIDNDYGSKLYFELSGNKISFSQNNKADVKLLNSNLSIHGTNLEVEYKKNKYSFSSSLVGQFNLENLLSVITLSLYLGLDSKNVQKGIQDVIVPGRNERIEIPNGASAIVDYAHTPDALERILQSIKPLTINNLICVFGCGGDRDKTKRPLMAKVAESQSDFLFITSDNPRTENPESILQDIVEGLEKPDSATVIEDRKIAINQALDKSKDGDCVVIAGKGHEDYQILGTQKNYFSDKDVIHEWIQNNPSVEENTHGS